MHHILLSDLVVVICQRFPQLRTLSVQDFQQINLTYLCGLHEAVASFGFVNVGEELNGCSTWQLRTLRRQGVLKVNNIICCLPWQLWDGVGLNEQLQSRVRSVGVVEDTAQVVPRRRVVGSRCDGVLHVSAPRYRQNGGDVRLFIILREFSPQDCIPVFVSLPRPRLEYGEEPVVPRRVVPNVFREHVVHEGQFSLPQLIVVEVCQQPLPIRPRMIVLLVYFQRSRDEGELRSGIARFGEDEPAMVPHLVRL